MTDHDNPFEWLISALRQRRDNITWALPYGEDELERLVQESEPLSPDQVVRILRKSSCATAQVEDDKPSEDDELAEQWLVNILRQHLVKCATESCRDSPLEDNTSLEWFDREQTQQRASLSSNGASSPSTPDASVDPKLPGHATNSAEAPPGPDCAGSFDASLSSKLRDAFETFYKDGARAAAGMAKRALTSFLGSRAEDLQAQWAWLFLCHNRQDQPAITLQVQCGSAETHLTGSFEKTVVSHVFTTRVPLLVSTRHDLKDGLRPMVNRAHSALCVPIYDPAGHLLGGIHFESPLEAAFSRAQLDDLVSSVGEFVPDLLVLRSIKEGSGCYAWYPCRDDWSVERVLGAWLHAAADILPRSKRACMSLAIWLADWPKEKMSVLATTGYDAEYVRNKTLSTINSFLGCVAKSNEGTVHWTNPDDRLLVCYDKARRMGVRHISGTPLFMGGQDDSTSHGAAVLYLFEDEIQERRFWETLLIELSSTCASLIADCWRQKQVLASAYAQQKLSKSQVPLATMMDVLVECLEAHECSVFVYSQQQRAIVSIGTTGLALSVDGPNCIGRTIGHHGLPGDQVAYRLDDERDKGFTRYLAENPGVCARKNDVPDPNEIGMPPDFPRLPTNKYKETRAISDTVHRRFLGISVAAGDQCLGVIRLIRSAESKPYGRNDELVLRDLSRQYIDLLSNEQGLLEQRQPHNDYIAAKDMSADNGNSRRCIISAVARILEPLSRSTVVPRRRVQQLLESVVTLFNEDIADKSTDVLYNDGEIVACFHELVRGDLPPRFTLLASHSSTQREVDRERTLSVSDGDINNVALLASEQRKVFTTEWISGFDLFGAPTSKGGECVSQAICPVIASLDQGQLEGVLSITSRRRIEWSSEDISLLQWASHSLSACLTGGNGNDCSVLRGDPLDKFVLAAATELAADWIRLELNSGELVKLAGEIPEFPCLDWNRIHLANNDELLTDGRQGAGQRCWLAADGTAARVELYVGPCAAGSLSWGPVSEQFFESPLPTIASIWRRWMNLTICLRPVWEGQFEAEEWSSHVRRWNESLKLSLQDDYFQPTRTDDGLYSAGLS